MGPWPSLDKASAFYYEGKREKAGDPGFNSPRARQFLGLMSGEAF